MEASKAKGSFTPALIVVDVQEDFCPPEGSLAVAGGRDIAPAINTLLSLPFALKVATRDFHPQDHISFGESHNPPNNKPFESSVRIPNPSNISQSREIPIWPVHCVSGTKGADIIPEIDMAKIDMTVEKGQDRMVEMFSCFADVFGNKSPEATNIDLADTLKDAGITHVFIVGIAGDFCVKCTALDARKEGFQVCVLEEVIKSVDPGEKGWGAAKEEMKKAGIKITGAGGPEVERVKNLS
ncbi:hypothetical protein N7G274_005221 [Stereocaulon virgatum]|uniref:nicotinamidase n=1 Tax=Stereocaulon virgatum TaxID=373712 RepID=A0ABR4AAD4_9LECA